MSSSSNDVFCRCSSSCWMSSSTRYDWATTTSTRSWSALFRWRKTVRLKVAWIRSASSPLPSATSGRPPENFSPKVYGDSIMARFEVLPWLAKIATLWQAVKFPQIPWLFASLLTFSEPGWQNFANRSSPALNCCHTTDFNSPLPSTFNMLAMSY